MSAHTSQFAHALFLALEGKNTAEQKKVLASAVRILRKQKREYLFPAISHTLLSLYRKKTEVEIRVARTHSSDIMKRLKTLSESIFGKQVSVHTSVRPELIGGFQMKGEEIFVRASVKDTLEHIKKHIIYTSQ